MGSFCLSQNTLCRTYEDAFPDDDDEWILDPALDRVMVIVGASPLLEFDLRPIEALQNWRNVLNRQRYKAALWQQNNIASTKLKNSPTLFDGPLSNRLPLTTP